MKNIIVLTVLLLVLGCTTTKTPYVYKPASYQSIAKNFGFGQKDTRYEVTSNDTSFSAFVKFEGKGYTFDVGFDTHTRQHDVINFLIRSTNPLDVDPKDCYYRVTDAAEKELFKGKGKENYKVDYAESDSAIFYYTTDLLILDDISYQFPLVVETITPVSRNKFVISKL